MRSIIILADDDEPLGTMTLRLTLFALTCHMSHAWFPTTFTLIPEC